MVHYLKTLHFIDLFSTFNFFFFFSEQCRRKKVKCDGAQAVCSNCVSLGLPCTYKESTKKVGSHSNHMLKHCLATQILTFF